VPWTLGILRHFRVFSGFEFFLLPSRIHDHRHAGTQALGSKMIFQGRTEARFKMNVIEEQASRQLSALTEVSETLQKAGIDYWLFGGWAVDFYVGSVTRLHDDIDLAVWFVDIPQITNLLLINGWRHAPADDEDGGTGFERGDIRLELTYLIRGDNGLASIPLHSGAVVWPGADALADDVGELHGVRSRLIGFESLLHGKATPRGDLEDAAKDRADFTHLSQLRS
jgi:aminoglycoside-2''-adenylyltransferase